MARQPIRRVRLAALLFATVSLSHAEGVLISAQPSDNSVLRDFDGHLHFWFSGNVSSRAPTLVVVDHAGNRVDKSDLRLVVGEHSELSASTGPLPVGPYAVRYRVLTRDGLVVSGISHFTIAP